MKEFVAALELALITGAFVSFLFSLFNVTGVCIVLLLVVYIIKFFANK